MGTRGLFAAIHRQAVAAAREADRQQRVAIREHNAALRKMEQAYKADERARAKAARAEEADRKRLEKEARAAHVSALEANVEERNMALAENYDEIDSLLNATLGVDDYVDLESFRRVVQHPPFGRPDLESPIRAPLPIRDPDEPVLQLPEKPRGLFGRRKYAKAVAVEERAYARARKAWEVEMKALPALREAQAVEYAQAERTRLDALGKEKSRYASECCAREAEIAEHNGSIDSLIANLGYGEVEAVQEYVSIVMSNSVYPECFPVAHEFSFEPSTAELRMRALVPPPGAIPTIKAYKYKKSSDEITSTELSQKAQKDRYASAIHQVALRSLHEVFEADRRGLIKEISLEVGTETADPATGQSSYVPFIAVAAERELFVSFDLSAVVPEATLNHLGAAVSKNPLNLVAVDTSGVRRS